MTIANLASNKTRWNWYLINNLFDLTTIKFISRLRSPNELLNNNIIWIEKFLAKSTYKLISREDTSYGVSDPIWRLLYVFKLQERYKIFIWKLLSNSLAFKSNLKRFIFDIDIKCTLCGVEKETCTHLFLNCSYILCL